MSLPRATILVFFFGFSIGLISPIWIEAQPDQEWMQFRENMISLWKRDVRIRGSVTDGTGRPLDGVGVKLTRWSPDQGEGSHREEIMYVDSEFELNVDGVATVELSFYKENHAIKRWKMDALNPPEEAVVTDDQVEIDLDIVLENFSRFPKLHQSQFLLEMEGDEYVSFNADCIIDPGVRGCGLLLTSPTLSFSSPIIIVDARPSPEVSSIFTLSSFGNQLVKHPAGVQFELALLGAELDEGFQPYEMTDQEMLAEKMTMYPIGTSSAPVTGYSPTLAIKLPKIIPGEGVQTHVMPETQYFFFHYRDYYGKGFLWGKNYNRRNQKMNYSLRVDIRCNPQAGNTNLYTGTGDR